MLIQRTNPPNLQVNHANNIVACGLFRFSHKQMSLVSFCNLLYFLWQMSQFLFILSIK